MTSPGYGCEGCDGQRPVVWLVTSLTGGITLSACADDFPIMMIPLLAASLETDPARLHEAIRRHLDRENKKAAQAASPGGGNANTDGAGPDHTVPGPGDPAAAETGDPDGQGTAPQTAVAGGPA